MSKVITQLYEKGNHAVEIYPNIVKENIPNDAIETDKIVDASITSDKLEDGAVTSDKLDNASVTTSKLGFGAVTGDNIDYKTITSDNIGDGEVTYDKLAFNLYYYTGIIATSNFYISFELYSITDLDVNTATTSDFLALLYENRKDATIYMAGHDITNNTLKVYRVNMDDNGNKIYINSIDETSNINIEDVIKTPIFH